MSDDEWVTVFVNMPRADAEAALMYLREKFRFRYSNTGADMERDDGATAWWGPGRDPLIIPAEVPPGGIKDGQDRIKAMFADMDLPREQEEP